MGNIFGAKKPLGPAETEAQKAARLKANKSRVPTVMDTGGPQENYTARSRGAGYSKDKDDTLGGGTPSRNTYGGHSRV